MQFPLRCHETYGQSRVKHLKGYKSIARACRAPERPILYWMDSLNEDFCLCMCRQNVDLSSAILFFASRFGCFKPLIAAFSDACQALGFALVLACVKPLRPLRNSVVYR